MKPQFQPTGDIRAREDVLLLIQSFYERILKSDIAYIFTEVQPIDLETHIPHIASFWSGLLLGDSTYSGNPMGVHIALAQKTKLGEKEFSTWLTLFSETVDSLFIGTKAEEAKTRANHIGALMKLRVNEY